mmetsp:Transcript_2470/g.1541  ORF Transcript_2470/g.1541 Transcript_2470/m.1541 type:complete len:173 (-) Transcript_2470:49-567(-)
MKVLYDNKIIHRDIKPENILLSEKSPEAILKLADFGFSKVIPPEERLARTKCGSLLYAAPEVMRGSMGYTFNVDLWSLGLILYEVLTGRVAFPANSEKELFTMQLGGYRSLRKPPDLEISPTAWDLLVKLIQPIPQKRPTFEEFWNHDFVQMAPQNSPLVYYAVPRTGPSLA